MKTGDARDQVGKTVGVSGKSIDYATKVIENGTPELVQAVEEGRMAVSYRRFVYLISGSVPPRRRGFLVCGVDPPPTVVLLDSMRSATADAAISIRLRRPPRR